MLGVQVVGGGEGGEGGGAPGLDGLPVDGPPALPAPQEEGKPAGPWRRSAGSQRPARRAQVMQLSRGATAIMGLCR